MRVARRMEKDKTQRYKELLGVLSSASPSHTCMHMQPCPASCVPCASSASPASCARINACAQSKTTTKGRPLRREEQERLVKKEGMDFAHPTFDWHQLANGYYRCVLVSHTTYLFSKI